ncbi:hypothetical protein GWI33_013755 [Rhynchophorus ferrugineus]|uniref:Uncharacterized protein n=1 Tax=Rhynchophorus ferrugineus TaxID=354439 RepID=A0A834M7I7_RHYFE|nr:hypothetical protein GWI33_013755 [Rhynchophorus ferrugineus]
MKKLRFLIVLLIKTTVYIECHMNTVIIWPRKLFEGQEQLAHDYDKGLDRGRPPLTAGDTSPISAIGEGRSFHASEGSQGYPATERVPLSPRKTEKNWSERVRRNEWRQGGGGGGAGKRYPLVGPYSCLF